MDKDLVLQNLKGYFDYFRSIYNVEKLQKEKEEREKKIRKYKYGYNREKIESMNKKDIITFIHGLWSGQRFTLKSDEKEFKDDIIKFLFNTNEDIATRWDNCNIYKLGDGCKSELLCCYYPNECAILNAMTKQAIKILGVDLSKEKFTGEKYEKYCALNKAIQEELKNNGFECENLLMVDYYLWEINEADNKKTNLTNNQGHEEIMLVDDENQKTYITQELTQELKSLAPNTILYGVPGCGKSYYINKMLGNMDPKYYKRILFHPEYTYSDFIGQVLPVVKGESISYEFQAGPFVKILKDALCDTNHNYYLIIEEINRGNAPGIFGDVFQLLDRKNNYESEYSIYNESIINDINKNLKEIRLPKNLYILATMNTSDQNVFTLDTAFKRRWQMRRIKNDFSNVNRIISCGNDYNKVEYNWKDFAQKLNEDILNNCNDGTVVEDKLVGAYFIKETECDKQIFAEKLFMYLWDDVVKYNKEQLFNTTKYNTLDKVIDGFVDGENVFSDNCINLNTYYKEIVSKDEMKNEE